MCFCPSIITIACFLHCAPATHVGLKQHARRLPSAMAHPGAQRPWTSPMMRHAGKQMHSILLWWLPHLHHSVQVVPALSTQQPQFTLTIAYTLTSVCLPFGDLQHSDANCAAGACSGGECMCVPQGFVPPLNPVQPVTPPEEVDILPGARCTPGRVCRCARAGAGKLWMLVV